MCKVRINNRGTGISVADLAYCNGMQPIGGIAVDEPGKLTQTTEGAVYVLPDYIASNIYIHNVDGWGDGSETVIFRESWLEIDITDFNCTILRTPSREILVKRGDDIIDTIKKYA